MPKKLTYQEVKSFIESFDYNLLSKEYKGSHAKLSLQCPKGHKFDMGWCHFKRGIRCPICYNNYKRGETQRLLYNKIKEYIESFDYKLLSNEYKNNKTNLRLQCPKGHVFEMKFNNFQQGQRCSYCYGNAKLKYDDIKFFIEEQGYQLLSNYNNSQKKLKIQCDKGHEFEMSWANFHRGRRCPICYHNSKSSKPEREIQNFISNIYDGVVISNDRNTIINPQTGWNLELDVYLPELNKAIEFNGSYWHSLPTNNDKVKSEQCRNNNIKLLVVNEENWNDNKEFCLQVIENFIN